MTKLWINPLTWGNTWGKAVIETRIPSRPSVNPSTPPPSHRVPPGVATDKSVVASIQRRPEDYLISILYLLKLVIPDQNPPSLQTIYHNLYELRTTPT